MKQITFIILLFTCVQVVAQNLVPNPNFGDVAVCDSIDGSRFLFHDWFDPPRPDTASGVGGYGFHDLCIDSTFKATRPGQNIQQMYWPMPKADSGYISIFGLDVWTFGSHPNFPNRVKWVGRSFGEVMLNQSLVKGDSLMVEFYTAAWRWSTEYVQNIGVHFSTDTFRLYDYLLPGMKPHVEADSILRDTTWTKVSGTYVAMGGEKFLTVGNFTPLDSCTRWDNPLAYWTVSTEEQPVQYFIDAVTVIPWDDITFSVSLPNDTLLCAGDSLLLHAVHDTGFALPVHSKSFLWSTGSSDSSITIGNPGTYWVEVQYNGKYARYDTIEVDYYPTYQSGLPAELQICDGQSAVLSANTQSSVSHVWSTGSTSNSTNLNQEGKYWLQSFTPCDTVNDTLLVSYYGKYSTSLPTDTVLCTNEPVELIAHEDSSVAYSWSNGGSSHSSTYYQGGEATLTVHTLCDTLQFVTTITEEDCEALEVYIPNSFSPDGDGLNDMFEIGNLPPDASLQIISRWGEVVYEARPYQNNWRGTTKSGKALPAGVYTYVLIYETSGKEINESGWVQVLR
ncbi:gliding motility-associated C-terminal domain-containing protein [Owenweeksia hongkongensis]|uniref:gliding motility-associated C-terminal domain-containing protein n=1 Tax=Owenweeksia hongkongensis TaxID=253245 RepID=UPI00145F7DA2|nr:gliding motility-associated C-terminal domain-containing protein [Owenweeksia hongkongensis]